MYWWKSRHEADCFRTNLDGRSAQNCLDTGRRKICPSLDTSSGADFTNVHRENNNTFTWSGPIGVLVALETARVGGAHEAQLEPRTYPLILDSLRQRPIRGNPRGNSSGKGIKGSLRGSHVSFTHFHELLLGLLPVQLASWRIFVLGPGKNPLGVLHRPVYRGWLSLCGVVSRLFLIIIHLLGLAPAGS
jgi:hypothetical protein